MTSSSEATLRSTRLAVGGALLAAVLLSASPVRAAPGEDDILTAKTLIFDARALRDKGDHVAALAKFKAAYALVPTPITGVELGKGYLALGKLIEARASLLDVVNMPAPSGEKQSYVAARAEAQTLADALSVRIPTLVVRVSGAASSRVTIDGLDLPQSALGVAHPLDPGRHVVRAVSPTGAAIVREVELAEREHRELSLDGADGDTAPPAAGSAPPRGADSSSPSRVAPLIVSGIGLVAVGIGGYLALDARRAWRGSNEDGHCSPAPGGGEDRCTARGLEIRADAREGGDRATIVMGVGAAAVVGGALWYLLTPAGSTPQSARLRVDVGLGSLGISGVFQ